MVGGRVWWSHQSTLFFTAQHTDFQTICKPSWMAALITDHSLKPLIDAWLVEGIDEVSHVAVLTLLDSDDVFGLISSIRHELLLSPEDMDVCFHTSNV